MAVPFNFRAMHAYRRLIHSHLVAFPGDYKALLVAHQTTRSEFLRHAGVTDKAELDELYAAAEDAARWLRSEVVQGQWSNQRKQYHFSLESRHWQDVPPGECITLNTPHDALRREGFIPEAPEPPVARA